ncbi:DEAD/DEAH box helicase [Brevibacterium luteolum]|uniref:DEAD/DEAH box helicase n=1 Tax=Brevibacterium luteolum TaxID=199591 RepID=UPI0021AEB218|nr:DEAD/DEAH box helicase [Brevibacterium luteolum]MCT1829604.1 DEAD/DEAH box helicase [Brevibacterium luteolum]
MAQRQDAAPARRLLDLVGGFGQREDRIRHVETLPARQAEYADWPDWVSAEVVAAWQSLGVERPWTHQAAAAQAAHAGEDTVISTGTASGKSLGFLLPVLEAFAATKDAVPRQQATAIYLSPTKALAHDQMEKVSQLVLAGLRPAAYDGDVSQAQKDWARAHANLIYTNPDMLHRTVLPQHARFARWLRNLRFIIVDEAHRYRGVFGSHVALVLRRLLRVAAHYGAAPVVIGASATMADPATAFARLTGRECTAVTEDGSPRAAGHFVLWEPPLIPNATGDPDADVFDALGVDDPLGIGVGSDGDDPLGLGAEAGDPLGVLTDGPQRRSTIAESADLLADAVCSDFSAIAFIASRRGTEALAEATRSAVSRSFPELTRTVAAYRGGYLPEERRLLETGLRNGRLRAVASTNALELGIDIAGLDLVVMAGWPGTLASLWQQAGRAGRAGSEWLAVLIARDDPLDTYVVNHPESVFGSPVDGGVIDPSNPYVLGGHLCAAAAERPLTEDDFALFGEAAEKTVAQLAAANLLRRRPTGWYWTKREPAAALTDIRGGGGGIVRFVDAATGTVLGTVDDAGALRQSHPGAVYVHQGQTFVVTDLDLDERVALVEPRTVDYTTQPKSVTEISIESVTDSRPLPSGGHVHLGMVEVLDQVTGYQIRQNGTGVVLSEHALDLPERTLRTSAVWWTVSESLVEDAEIVTPDLPGAVHAAEHASIGLLPLFAGCDRWDIGGVSTDRHADTGKTTVFVYDGQPGGAGFAERGFRAFDEWQTATLVAIEACECLTGCPSCVQSPKCGNGNNPLDKDAAARILTALLRGI